MKYLGILIVCAGVALAAAFGARLSPPMHEYVTAKGRARLLPDEEDALHEAYCAARTAASLPPADGCAKAAGRLAGLQGAPIVVVRRTGKTEASGTPSERLAVLREVDAAELPAEVSEKRAAWLDGIEAMLAAGAAFGAMTPPDPSARATQWGTTHGPLFGLGLLLVIVGAVVARGAMKREALREPSSADSAPPSDLGHLLEDLRAAVEALGAAMDAVPDPARGDHDRLKDGIQELQAGPFELVVNARFKVQARYGMAGFAEVYGPIASAERYVNRAWSALVDQHWPEARASVQRAASDLAHARSILMELATRK